MKDKKNTWEKLQFYILLADKIKNWGFIKDISKKLKVSTIKKKN